jgi:hypothetical protein
VLARALDQRQELRSIVRLRETQERLLADAQRTRGAIARGRLV